jgi:hypothetical protein
MNYGNQPDAIDIVVMFNGFFLSLPGPPGGGTGW